MTIKTSGQLKFSEIEAEFQQGTNPIMLSEYYRGGPEVPDGPAANANIAKTGQQKLSNYYGAADGPPPPYDPDHDAVHDMLVSDPHAYYYIAAAGPGCNVTEPHTMGVIYRSGLTQDQPRFGFSPGNNLGFYHFPLRVNDHAGHGIHMTGNPNAPNTNNYAWTSDPRTQSFGGSLRPGDPLIATWDAEIAALSAYDQQFWTKTTRPLAFGGGNITEFKAPNFVQNNGQSDHFNYVNEDAAKLTGYFSQYSNWSDNGEAFTGRIGKTWLNASPTATVPFGTGGYILNKKTDGVSVVIHLSVNFRQLAAHTQRQASGFFVFKILDPTRNVAVQLLCTTSEFKARAARGYDYVLCNPATMPAGWHDIVMGVQLVHYCTSAKLNNVASGIDQFGQNQGYVWLDKPLNTTPKGRTAFPTSQPWFNTRPTGTHYGELAGEFDLSVMMGVIPSSVRVHAMAGFTSLIDQPKFTTIASTWRGAFNNP